MSERRDKERELLPPRENDWPKPVLTLLGLGLIAISCFLLHWAGNQEKFNAFIDKPVSFSAGPILSLEQITNAPQKDGLIGLSVVLSDVKVIDVPGDYTFWIGNNAGDKVLVALLGEVSSRQHEKVVTVESGERIFLFGVILPILEANILLNQAFISEEEKRLIKEQKLYISALRLAVMSGS